MKRCILYILFIFLNQNCIITSTPGFYSGYSRLSHKEKEQVVFLDDSSNLCELKNDGKIYAINGEMLYKCIDNKENALIYFWDPCCSSEYCYTLSHIKKYCSSHGLFLYIIADYYDNTVAFFEEKNNLTPLFSINENFYKTRYCDKYKKLFLNDLIKDKKTTKKVRWHKFFIFKKGKLAASDIKMDDDNFVKLE